MEIHLVALSVTKRRCRTCCITEWSVESRCIFYCIGHDRCFLVSCFVQAFTDRTHTSVHHIRRCYHVRTCLDVRKSCLCKQFQSCVVFYIVSAENTAVSVGSVLTHAYVCNIVEIRKLFFCLTECSLYDSVFVVGTASDFILVIRNAEQHDIADSGFRQTLQFIWKTVHTVAELSFHRRDLFFDSCSLFYK